MPPLSSQPSSRRRQNARSCKPTEAQPSSLPSGRRRQKVTAAKLIEAQLVASRRPDGAKSAARVTHSRPQLPSWGLPTCWQHMCAAFALVRTAESGWGGSENSKLAISTNMSDGAVFIFAEDAEGRIEHVNENFIECDIEQSGQKSSGTDMKGSGTGSGSNAQRNTQNATRYSLPPSRRSPRALARAYYMSATRGAAAEVQYFLEVEE